MDHENLHREKLFKWLRLLRQLKLICTKSSQVWSSAARSENNGHESNKSQYTGNETLSWLFSRKVHQTHIGRCNDSMAVKNIKVHPAVKIPTISRSVSKWPSHESAMIAPMIGEKYEMNSFEWKIAVDVSWSKPSFLCRNKARIAEKKRKNYKNTFSIDKFTSYSSNADSVQENIPKNAENSFWILDIIRTETSSIFAVGIFLHTFATQGWLWTASSTDSFRQMRRNLISKESWTVDWSLFTRDFRQTPKTWYAKSLFGK